MSRATRNSEQLVAYDASDRPEMSSAEAQSRLIAALAARAYSEQQMNMVSTAKIIDADSLDHVKRSLAQLPQENLVALINHMIDNPAALEDESLANHEG